MSKKAECLRLLFAVIISIMILSFIGLISLIVSLLPPLFGANGSYLLLSFFLLLVCIIYRAMRSARGGKNE